MNVADRGYVLWGWCYPNVAAPGRRWWLGWGIRFSGGAEWFTDLVPAPPQYELTFLMVGSDRKDFPLHLLPTSRRPAGWLWPDRLEQRPSAAIVRALSEFYSSPRGFTEEFKAWLGEHLDEALAIFSSVEKGA
jgi:hypothetical protein